MPIKSRRSQSILDFAVAFIAIAGLIVGITRIWIWFNANYAKRQAAFQSNRLVAAGPARPYDTQNEPVKVGFNPLDLTDDWVFKGRPSGTISGALLGEEGGYSLADKCKAECNGEAGCTGLDGNFNPNCPCALKCNCLAQIQTIVDIYIEQAASLRNQASSLRSSANSMRDAADECDDPWELCWWGDWGKTPKQLREAASRLDFSASQLERSAANSDKRAADSKACCDKPSGFLQSECLDGVEDEATCDSECMSEAQSYYDSCVSGGGWRMVICPSLANDLYANCFNTCINGETEPCSDRVNSAISYLQSEVNSLISTRDRYQEILDDINSTLSACRINADETCTSSCEDAEDPNACYSQCYEIENNICIASACNGSAASSCSSQCQGSPDPDACYNQCYAEGTSNCAEHRANLMSEIENIKVQITALQQNIQQLPSCCSFGDVAQQNACIEENMN